MAGYTELTVETAGTGGSILTYNDSDDSNGDMFDNDGKTFVDVYNADASDSATITFVRSGKAQGLDFVAYSAVTILKEVRRMFGPFPISIYNVVSGTDQGKVYIDYGGTAPEEFDVAVFH